MVEPAGSPENPYVGPSSFEAKDRRRFFGRETELLRLRSLAVSRRAVLLYSRSGAGKSSLLKAGLLPALHEKIPGSCLPVARVGGGLSNGVEAVNPYVFHLLTYLLGEHAGPADLLGLSLTDGLGRVLTRMAADFPDGEAPEVVFLTLDQLEEVFSTDPQRHAEREDFFRQLQQAFRDHPKLTLLLALREEWLAHLDPHLDRFPDRLRSRFRLDLLDREKALRAVIEPAAGERVTFHREAAERLVDDLLKSQAETPEGAARQDAYVDPVQLQVVCRRLWELRPAGTTEIDDAQRRAYGNVDSALADYYKDRVREAAGAMNVPEREIRDWCERELIRQGRRRQIPREPERTQGLGNRAVDALLQAHLLREEPLRGTVWYELAHDRLIGPVLRNNQEWRRRNETWLERRARLWEKDRRPDLLLSGSALKDAQKEREQPAVVQEFLEACRRRKSSRTVSITLLAVLLVLLAALLANVLRAPALGSWAGYGALSRVRADMDEMARRRIDRAVLLALASAKFEAWLDRWTFWGADRRELPDPRLLLFRSLAANPSLVELVHHTPAVRRPAALRPALLGDGRTLVEGRRDGTFVLLDAATGAPRSAPVDGGVGPITAVAVAPQGGRLAVGGTGGAVQLWDLATLRPAAEPFQALGEEVLALAFHPDGATLDSVHGRATAVWRPHAGPPFGQEVSAIPFHTARTRWALPAWLSRKAPGVTGAARSPGDPDLVATVSPEGIFLWDLTLERLAAGPFRGHRGEVVKLSFDPSGRRLYSEGNDGKVLRWDVDFSSWERRADRIANREIECPDVQDYFPQNLLTRWFLNKVLEYPPSLVCQPDSIGESP